LTGDEERRVGSGDRLGEIQRIEEGAALARRPGGVADVTAADLLLQRLVLAFQLTRLGRPSADYQQLIVRERLLDVVERTLVDRLDGGVERRLCRHEDDGNVLIQLPGGVEDVDATYPRHADVGEYDI